MTAAVMGCDATDPERQDAPLFQLVTGCKRYGAGMCAQCAATGAVVATAGAAGVRVWVAARLSSVVSPTALKALSGVVIIGGVAAAGLLA